MSVCLFNNGLKGNFNYAACMLGHKWIVGQPGCANEEEIPSP